MRPIRRLIPHRPMLPAVLLAMAGLALPSLVAAAAPAARASSAASQAATFADIAGVTPGKRDPLASTMWRYYHEGLLEKRPVVFDDRVRVEAPPFAEDARQVPVSVDASALAGDIERIEVWAERNPIPRVFSYHPESSLAVPRMAIRIRVEQATPIRAAVLTKAGVWHVGSVFVEAAGGGCTAPSVVRAEGGWEQRLGQIRGGRFTRAGNDRLRLLVSHPMDNGLVGGVPEFYVDEAEVFDARDRRVARMQFFPAVSENPALTLDVGSDSKAYRVELRDNNGNRFGVAL